MKEYSSHISLLLVLTYLIAVFQFTVPYFSYYSNYTYFATEACINKQNPELECNGKCQLKKMVENQHNQHSGADEGVQTQKTTSSTIFFCQEYRTVNPYLPTDIFRTTTSKSFSPQIFERPATPPPRLG